MRRRVLALLDAGPATAEQLERALPRGSDVDFTRSALRGLIEEGLVAVEAGGGYRRASAYVPWYERAGPEPNAVLRIICDNLAQHFGSRYSPQAEVGDRPASALSVVHRVVPGDRERYMESLFALVREFDRSWSEREPAPGEGVPMGAEVVFGPLPRAQSAEALRDAHRASVRGAKRAGAPDAWPTHAHLVDDAQRDEPDGEE